MEGGTLTPSTNRPQRKNYHGYQPQGQHWMTPEISAQLQVCNQLRKASEATNKPEDHEAYQAQCRKVHSMMEESKASLGLVHLPALPSQYGYGRQNEHGYNGYQPTGPMRNSNFQQGSGKYFQGNNRKPISCGPCNRTFFNKQKLEEHLKEHVECPFPECKLSAHIKVIDQHINNQHMLVNFASLQIDDETWISERKKRFPSIQRAELRRAEQIEKLKRGEKLGLNKKPFKSKIKSITSKNENDTAGAGSATTGVKRERPQNESGKDEGKRKGKFRRKRQEQESFNKPSQPVMKVDLLDSDDETRDGLRAFRGTKCFYEELGEVSYFGNKSINVDKEDSAEPEENIVISDDEDWQDEDNKAADTKGALILGGALGSLMGAYSDSEDESTDEAVTSRGKDNPQSVPKKIDEGSSSKVKADASVEVAKSQDKSVDIAGTQDMLVEVAKQDSSANAEVKQDTEQRNESTCRTRNRRMQRKKVPKGPPKPHKLPRRRKTLLEKLLQADIIHERNVILQCVRFVLENNFFDGKNSVGDKKINDSSKAEKESKKINDSSKAEKESKKINDSSKAEKESIQPPKEGNSSQISNISAITDKDNQEEKHVTCKDLGHQISSENSKTVKGIKNECDSNKKAARRLKKQLLEDDAALSAPKRRKSDTEELSNGEEIKNEVEVKRMKLSEEEQSSVVVNADTIINGEKIDEKKESAAIETDSKSDSQSKNNDESMACEEVQEKITDKGQESLLEVKKMKFSEEEKSVDVISKNTISNGEKDDEKKESEVSETDDNSEELKESNIEIANHKEQKEMENNITDS
ncbi:vacuolar protein sorting-associated protein 72-like [Penaeus chinensis]|uniref:vacuolar protein sorting-associated protein 72-like n=1 Tax=Penaeus chinensis TaxID=139456 RepID=UPI001FB70063|nr:vacuolar protein sorting-associated protein 72-like [Penaeus chinensis]